MSGERYAPDEFEQAIALAVEDRNLEAAVSLLTIYAAQHPREAGVLYDGIQAALRGDDTELAVALLRGRAIRDRDPIERRDGR